MDPLTAVMNAIAAFNNFLCTPAGQLFATRQGALVDSLLTKLHLKLAPDPADQKPPSGKS